jgi:uncharacterized protein (TIGR02466 family)
MLIDLFPVTVHLSEVRNHNKVKNICMNYVEKAYAENPSTFVDPWDADVFTTFGQQTDLDWNQIMPNYLDNIVDLAHELGIAGHPAVTDMWINAYKTNQSQEVHDHSPGHFSAIHYIKYDSDQHLPTIFINPYKQASISNKPEFHSDIDQIPQTYVGQSFVKVKEGDLLIFPAFFEHKVPRQKTDELRVTLAFNFNFVK